MPILTPSYLPPAPGLASPSPSCASSDATCHSAPRSQVPTPLTSPEQDPATRRSDVPLKRERALKVPSVKLDVHAIQEDMAASLAVALLGHVLFLKSQVPLPVAQLGRVPGAASAPASRAAKKRSDMITAFDVLSSHLHTTFSALSTALARNPAHRSTDTVYLALVLGPTIGAPKARVVLALEGLEVKIWGLRGDIDRARRPSSDSTGEDDDDDDDGCSSDDGNEAGEDSTHGDTDTEDDDADADGDDGDAVESPPASEPPSSRSPSPSSEEPSQPSSSAPARRPLRPSLSPNSSPSSSCASQPYLAPKPTRTYAEEQLTLRAAERLLSRTLANAYAEGSGMAAELAPTQTHVLLRAPRRFSHPAWLPRQNVSATLDNMLQDFLADSGLGDAASAGAGGDAKMQRRRGVAGIKTKTEGVLVTCQNGPDNNNDGASSHPVAAVPTIVTEAREEDELIWWAWDGKLVGFAEW